MNSEIIMLNIVGHDQPGVTAALMDILGQCNANILDIGQSNIHHHLALGILFQLPDDQQSASVFKYILFKASEFGLNVKFTPIEEERYNNWVERQGKKRYIVTVLGKTLSAKQLSYVTQAITDQQLNIDSIKRLTGRPALQQETADLRSCVELSVRGTCADKQKLTELFLRYSAELGVDISFQQDDIFRCSRRLICFDMDSTLIKTEVIDELADRAGVGRKCVPLPKPP